MTTQVAVFNHSSEILSRFREFLEHHGFEVATYHQDVGVLPELREFAPDLIILGHVRGYPTNYPEFIRYLRSVSATQVTPILVCTTGELRGNDDTDEAVQYVPIGEDALNLDYVLVGIRLALKLDSATDE